MNNTQKKRISSCWKVFLMILMSTAIIYMVIHYHTYQYNPMYFSRTRVCTALYMGIVITLSILIFITTRHKKINVRLIIYTTSVVLFLLSIWGFRLQMAIDPVNWKQEIITYHSIVLSTITNTDNDEYWRRQLAENNLELKESEIREVSLLVEEGD
ncbi:hypothetical protein AAJP47_01590 [Psychrobacter sp. B38]|uniref:hypothetical protein n=1 Tax=Psychrobacter sp. B38 TaxID=3143538 RepID=UPI003210691F